MIDKNNIFNNIKSEDSLKLTIENTSSDKKTAFLFQENEQIGSNLPIIIQGDGSGELVNFPSVRNYISSSTIDTYNNKLYIITQGNGILVYNILTKQIDYITTTSQINGTSITSNFVGAIYYDAVTKKIYAGLGDGNIWIYNTILDEGEIINAQIYQTPFFIFVFNDIIYTGTGNIEFFVKIENGIKTNLSNNNGDSISSYIKKIVIHENTNTLYFTLAGDNNVAFCSYDINNNFVKKFTTSTQINGDMIPTNITKHFISINNDEIYIPTTSGIYIYNILTNTGNIINTSTQINGDNLPDNNCYSVTYNDFDNNIYVNSGATLWRYDFLNNTGELLGNVSSGSPRPSSSAVIDNILLNGTLFEIVYTGTSTYIWRWNEYILQSGGGSNSGIIISSGSSTTYPEILNEITTRPLLLKNIIYKTENEQQKLNNLRPVFKSPQGTKEKYEISIRKYITPEYPYNVIPIKFEKPIIVDNIRHYIEMEVEPNTIVEISFWYKQLTTAELIKLTSKQSENQEIINIDEYQKPEIKKVSAINPEGKFLPQKKFKCPLWLCLAAAYILYKLVKSNNNE